MILFILSLLKWCFFIFSWILTHVVRNVHNPSCTEWLLFLVFIFVLCGNCWLQTFYWMQILKVFIACVNDVLKICLSTYSLSNSDEGLHIHSPHRTQHFDTVNYLMPFTMSYAPDSVLEHAWCKIFKSSLAPVICTEGPRRRDTGPMKENISLLYKLLHWLYNAYYIRKRFVQKYVNYLYCLLAFIKVLKILASLHWKKRDTVQVKENKSICYELSFIVWLTIRRIVPALSGILWHIIISVLCHHIHILQLCDLFGSSSFDYFCFETMCIVKDTNKFGFFEIFELIADFSSK